MIGQSRDIKACTGIKCSLTAADVSSLVKVVWEDTRAAFHLECMSINEKIIIIKFVI